MICPECNGRGEVVYYVETDRDENTVTIKQRKGICRNCNGSGKKPMSNADRIRSMTVEELAEILGDKCICPPTSECAKMCGDCVSCWLEWLQHPAEKPKEVAENETL